MNREWTIDRKTKETDIKLYINLDGNGECNIKTGIGFFDHMLNLLAFHGEMNFNIECNGDLDVCDHHTIEDVGIALGEAFKNAIGDKRGIERYGNFYIPMDEALARVSVDISGRPYLVFNGEFEREAIGSFSTEMTEEFFRAFAFNGGITLHANIIYGKNDHHKIEALFKALGRALKEAKKVTSNKIQSTKGII